MRQPVTKPHIKTALKHLLDTHIITDTEHEVLMLNETAAKAYLTDYYISKSERKED